MEMVKQSITYACPAIKVSTTAMAEGEVSPPNTMPPINRILSIDGWTSATGQPEDDQLLMDGKVTLNILYVCDSGRVHGFESVAFFKHSVELPGCHSKMSCYVQPTIGEIQSRLIGGAVSVRCAVTLACECRDNAEIDAVASLQGAQSRNITFKAYSNDNFVDEVNLREDIRLPRSADKLLGVSGYARIQNVVLEGSKAVVEGVMRVNILFCTPDGTLVQAPASLPLSHRMPLPEGVEKAIANVQTLNLTAALADEDVATVETQLSIMLEVEVGREFDILSDAYATDAILECVGQPILLCESKQINCRCTLRQTLEIPKNLPAADRVLIVQLRPGIENARPNAGTISLAGTMRCSIVYLCREGNLHSFEAAIPFECEGEAASLQPDMEVMVNVAGELVHAGASGMEIPLQSALDIALFVRHDREISVITSIQETDRTNEDQGIIAYFPDESESLWDIGKRFGICLEEMEELNPDIRQNPGPVLLNLRKRGVNG